jgi:hypothetical protein
MRFGKLSVVSAAALLAGLAFVSEGTAAKIVHKHRVNCQSNKKYKARPGRDVCVFESHGGLDCKNKGVIKYVQVYRPGKKDPCGKLGDKNNPAKWHYDYKPCTTASANATAKIVVDYYATGKDACLISINKDPKPCGAGYRYIKNFSGNEDYCVKFQ